MAGTVEGLGPVLQNSSSRIQDKIEHWLEDNGFGNPFTPANPVQVSGLHYELTDHLGNVRGVVKGALKNGQADIVSLSDYYPAGMVMPGRNFIGDDYRYGYQSSEKDDEIKGGGNSYNTFYRMNDPRLIRWFSTDPKAGMTPWESPYMSMGGNPVLNTDVLGDKWKEGESAKRADGMRKEANKLNTRLEAKKNDLERSLSKAEKGSKRYNSITAKLKNVSDKLSEVSNLLTELNALENSPQLYELRVTTPNMQAKTYVADKKGYG